VYYPRDYYYPGYYYPGWGSYYPGYGWGGYLGWGYGLSYYSDPFWYGGFGYPGYYGGYSGYGYGEYGGSGVARGYNYTGSLKLKVKPKEAEVYADGYFVGIVDDFDGMFQDLSLTADPTGKTSHKIEIRAPGAKPLTFEVRLQPGQSITYRGELLTPSEPKR
jgi:hypothetical protein